jgi:ribosome-binding protein aMBF1 (putative translation factor)
VRITTEHPRSSYGIPVILDDDGEPLDYAPGVRAVRRALGISTAELAGACGKSRRTVEDWIQGRYMVPASALYVMKELLERQEANKHVPK